MIQTANEYYADVYGELAERRRAAAVTDKMDRPGADKMVRRHPGEPSAEPWSGTKQATPAAAACRIDDEACEACQ